ncbi:MAG: DNA polymerase III subunit chi, partial [Variovorax sp.]
MQVDFYHLGASGVERVLPRIAERVLADGARLLVVAGDAALAEQLDGALWDYAPESFLPHGQAGAGDETAQPELIATDLTAANAARHV